MREPVIRQRAAASVVRSRVSVARLRATSAARFFGARPSAAVGGTVSAIIVLAALSAPFLAPYDPLEFHVDSVFARPSPEFLLGTDRFGRDVLTRVMWGAQTSLIVGVTAVLIGQAGGGAFGLVSAYVGGTFDLIAQRVIDVLMVFPSLILALLIVAALGGSLTNVIVAIALAQAPAAVRTIRATALGVKEGLFVEAARAVGCTDRRIMLVHIWPNTVSVLLVVATASLAHAILAEASLSFLGLGVPPPNPSWGAMLSGDGREFLTRAPWMAISAGTAITLAVLGFNLLGDALRDALDPRLRKR